MSDAANGHVRTLLRDVAAPFDGAFVDGPFGSNLKSDEYVDSGVRLIQLQNIGEGYWKDDNRKYITDLKFRSLARHGAIPGDIAIAKMADPVARACMVPSGQGQYVVVADCIRLRVDEKRFDPRYVVRAINSHGTRTEAERKSIGSTRVRINLGTLKTVGCLVPPLPQQRAIADILDTLDTTIRQTEAIIEKLKQVKQGLLHDLLTRGIDANGELRPPQSQAPHLYKDSPLGWIPSIWAAQPMAELVRQVTYGFTNPMPTTTDGPWMLTAADIADGHIDYSSARKTARREFVRLSRKSRPSRGDILVTKDGTLGRVALLDRDDVCVNQSVAVLSPLEPESGAFIAQYLRSPRGQDRMIADAGGSTIKHIYITALADMLVPSPPTTEATEIGRRALAAEQRIRYEVSSLSKLGALKSGLMEDLLTGRVRVTSLLDAAAPA
jgi:type I restriction enzyme S subunit